VSLFSLLDRVLDATVLPGYSKTGYELRRLAWPERGRIDTQAAPEQQHQQHVRKDQAGRRGDGGALRA